MNTEPQQSGENSWDIFMPVPRVGEWPRPDSYLEKSESKWLSETAVCNDMVRRSKWGAGWFWAKLSLQKHLGMRLLKRTPPKRAACWGKATPAEQSWRCPSEEGVRMSAREGIAWQGMCSRRSAEWQWWVSGKSPQKHSTRETTSNKL